MLRGAQINYMLDKSHLIIIIINTQCQIVQIQRCSMKLCRIWKVVATIRSAKQEPNKIPFSAQVQIRASFCIEMVSSGILRFPLAKRTCLISLQPSQVSFDAFYRGQFLIWPRVLIIMINNNCSLTLP